MPARHIDCCFLYMWQRRTAGVEIERQAGVDPAKLRWRKLGRGWQPLQACEDQSKDEPQLRIERAPGCLELREEGRGREAVASPMVGNAAALAPIALMTSRRDAMESSL